MAFLNEEGLARLWTNIVSLFDSVKSLVGDTPVSEQIEAAMTEGQPDFTGATAEADGIKGAVPAPLAGDQDKYLCADGTWSDIILPGEETTTETIGSMDIHVDTADTAYDSEKLGGITADEYLLKSEVPIASQTTAGIIKVGYGLQIDEDGVLSILDTFEVAYTTGVQDA